MTNTELQKPKLFAFLALLVLTLIVLGFATYGVLSLINAFLDKNVVSPRGFVQVVRLQKPRLWVEKATYQKELDQEKLIDQATNEAVDHVLNATPTPKPRSLKIGVVLAMDNPVREWTGLASFYNWAGCLGCNSKRIMANGKPLVDGNLTLAFQRLPLGSKVRVTNLRNNMFVVAEVTDRGGFEPLGRIADLSEGTKDAINCSDLCTVKIEEVK